MQISRILMLCLVGLVALPGCGEEPQSASVSTGLMIPRALSDELGSIVVYLFETDRTARPLCDDLLDDFPNWEDKVFKRSTIEFDINKTPVAVIDGIPDRGQVWRFHARGYTNSGGTGTHIAHGCTIGVYEFKAGQEVQVSISLEAVQ
jgi:hypothetical protein